MSCLVEIKGLSFNYQDGQPALDEVNLSICRGEKVGIVGSNGAGKSTLLLHLNGVLRGDGEVFVAGNRISPETLGKVRSWVGLVFQDPDDQLFSPTVFEDVAFGPLYSGLDDDEVRNRVREALDAVGMSGMEERVPNRMSLGEKKLISVATVLAMRPKILALDEPTAALDARARRLLREVLRKLDETIIIATHDLTLVSEIMDRAVVMDKGRVVADGTSSEILDNHELLTRHGLI